MPVLGSWAERIVAQRGVALDRHVRERLDVHLLDTAGALVAGHGTTEGRRLLSFAQDEPGRPALLDGGMLDRIAMRVALVRHTEIDDIDIPSCVTPGAIATMTALTLAEHTECGPGDVAAAILASYRVMTDLARAAGGSGLLNRGFWPSYVVAPLGAAAAAAGVLRLDAAATAHAMALALAQTAASPGGPSEPNPRWLLLGLAARSGAVAALMAARGVPGDPTLLDGDWLATCHGVGIDRALLEPVSDDVLSGMSIKPFASAKQAMCAVNAFQEIVAEHRIDPAAIAAIRAFVLPEHLRMVGHDRVTISRSARLTSVPHLIALSACAPDLLMDVERGPTDNAAVTSLRAKVSVAADPALAGLAQRTWPARVEVETSQGAVHARTVVSARGDPDRRLDLDSTAAKLLRVTRGVPDRGVRLAEAAALIGRAGCNPDLLTWLRDVADRSGPP